MSLDGNSPVVDYNETECDPYVEHLRKKYLATKELHKPSDSSSHCSPNDFSSAEIVNCSPSSSLTASEKQHYMRAMEELRNLLQIGENKLENTVAEYESVLKKDVQVNDEEATAMPERFSLPQRDHEDSEATLTQSMTLPMMSSDSSNGNSGKPRKSVRISLEPTTFFESDFSTGIEGSWPGPGILRTSSRDKKMQEADIKVIHAELMSIHMKLNYKSQELARLQSDLEEKQEELMMREERLSEKEKCVALNDASVQRAQDVMVRLQGVEMKVQEKFAVVQECHAAEIHQLNGNLSEQIKEFKRLKNSFDVLKSQNDDLKAQGTELSEFNQKLRIQNQKLKKRLENLQRRQEYQSSRNNATQNQVLTDHTNKCKTDEKISTSVSEKTIIDKSSKVWNNSFEALSVSLEWLSDVHLRPSATEKQGQRTCKEIIIDKCLKVLPLLVEVIRYLPLCTVQSKHHLPYLRFIYWSLHHLEDTHHTLLSSTARRIGEELIKPSILRSVADSSILSSSTSSKSLQFSGCHVDNKSRNQIFFRSSDVEVRMLSSFIIIRTLHQVDMLAQVFDQLKKDLKDEMNRKYFLEYSATQVVMPFLTFKTNRSLLSSAVDVMLQMAMESSNLPAFLQLCSTESWFRSISSAVRSVTQTSDSGSLEKLSIILQKLSKIKNNKKYFEMFSLGRVLQDQYRECDPGNTFLSLNLRSILFNLNMIKAS